MSAMMIVLEAQVEVVPAPAEAACTIESIPIPIFRSLRLL